MSYPDAADSAIRLAAGTALLCAAALLAGCRGMSDASAGPAQHPGSPRAAASAAQPAVLPATAQAAAPASAATVVTTVGATIYSGGDLSITLTSMAVAPDHTITAYVSYRNEGSSALGLFCSGITSPALDTLTTATGAVIPASHSYCSDHPAATIGLAPGGVLLSYAVFDGVPAQSGPFAFTWQRGLQFSGTVAGITVG